MTRFLLVLSLLTALVINSQTALGTRWYGFGSAGNFRLKGSTGNLKLKDVEIGFREDGVLLWRYKGESHNGNQ